MLREVVVDKKPDGRIVNVPAEVTDAKVDQYVKRFIEIADYNYQDGSGVVSLFRTFHGGQWTLRILQRVLDELKHPSIQLDIKNGRSDLAPFFEELVQRHQDADDSDFGYPNRDRSRLPM